MSYLQTQVNKGKKMIYRCASLRCLTEFDAKKAVIVHTPNGDARTCPSCGSEDIFDRDDGQWEAAGKERVDNLWRSSIEAMYDDTEQG